MSAWKFDYEEKRKAAADAEYVEKGMLPAVRKEIDWSRGVECVEIDGIDRRDHPDYCDAFISYAEWADTGEELNDAELEELNSDSGFVYDQVIQRLY
jgi:hypothetical protein